ncbi:hypothetical protein Tco_1124558 [Tanacetum coccineum]|uniref:Transposase (Putative), gypsy type n=1 Tax=Tanacetum coccineum TaxID=301880 RepID=A0ABQ5J998_9ASTR
MLFAELQSLCSSWPCADYASLRIREARVSYGRVWIMFLVGVRIVLTVHSLLLRPLDGMCGHINLSQLSIIGAAKIDALVCPLSTSWFSGTSIVKDPLSVDEAVDLPCVELLNENRTIIRMYSEIFLCLVGLSHSFTKTDVHPTLLHNNDEEMGLLDCVNSANPFKVKIGERTLAENEVSLLTETKDRVISPSSQPISLVDHTIRDELNVNAGKRKKIVAFVFGSPPVKKARIKGVIISNSRPSTAGKSLTALRRLIRQSGQANTGSRSAAPVTEDAIFSSVAPTLEHAFEDDNVRRRPPSDHFVVLSSGSADTDSPTSPQVVSYVSSAQAGVSVPVTEPASDGHTSSAPELKVGTLSATPSQDNPVTCRNLLDHVNHPSYWAALRNQHDARFLDSFNINSAQHVCMVSELRLRYEHDIIMREKYEKKFTDSAAVVQQRDAEIVDLRARLEKSKAEATEAAELLKRVSDLEVMVVVMVGEVATLNTKNASLSEKVSALELVRKELDGKVAQLTADCDGLREQVVGEKQAAALDARIADVRRDMDNDLYLHMLTAIARRRWVVGHGIHLAVHKFARSVECRSALGKVISMAINKSIQQGLKAGVVHDKAGRSLSQIEAYDPEIEGKYVAAVSKFKGVSFPLLDELESLKDSPLALIMSALTLKDDHGNTNATSEFRQFQPSLDQVIMPIYSESDSIDREMLLSDAILTIRQSAERRRLCSPSSSTLGGASSFAPPYDSSLGVADYQVSTLVLSGMEGPLISHLLFSRMITCLMHLFWISMVMFDVSSL